MSREAETIQKWLESQRDSVNPNGMLYSAPAPLSTREAAEIRKSQETQETEPTPRPPTAAGTYSVPHIGSVRERIERDQAKKRVEEPPIHIPKYVDPWIWLNQQGIKKLEES